MRRHRQDGRGRRPGGRRTVAAGQRRAADAVCRPSKLILGTNCGGSDGNSGVTANPALGVASDLLVAAGRHQHPRRNAGNLRGRASADPPGRQPRGRREAGRAHQVVGVVHRHLRRGDQQQSVAGQQGRRPDDDLREIAGRHRQGRQHGPGRRGAITPSRSRRRASWSWTRPATIR